MVDPYEVLGVERGADAATVTKAYRSLARQFHPDRYATSQPQVAELAAKRMAEINIAHQVLTDPEAARRVRHSEMRRDAATGRGPAQTVYATSAHTAAPGGPSAGRPGSTLTDIIDEIVDPVRGGQVEDAPRAPAAEAWTMHGDAEPRRRRRFRRG